MKKLPMTKIEKVLWSLFLFTLPVTSFPYFLGPIGGDIIVRPLSIFPLLGLIMTGTIPALFRKPVPRTFQTLVPFLLAATTSSVLSLLHGINPTFAVSVVERLTRGLVTLGVGTATYLTAALIPSSFEKLRSSLRWLYAGFGLALLWGSAQAVYVIRFSPTYFNFINNLQSYVSTRRLFENRISGMTYEPNWFGGQLSFVLIPWLLSSVLNNYTVFSWRWRKVTVEWLLLGWSIVILVFTFSRAGFAILLSVLFLGVILLRIPDQNLRTNLSNNRWIIVRRIIEGSLVFSLVIGLIFITGSNNSFFKRIWDYWSTKSVQSIDGYFKYLGFGARFTFGKAAFNVFEQHPIFGVGLGNYAFYFEEAMPAEAIAEIPEVLRLVTQNVTRYRLMTPKNLFLRILAETGLVGLGTFIPFLLALFGSVLYLYFSPHQHDKFWGTAGLCLLVAFSLSAMSFDSFAIPNMWVIFGLLTAATWSSEHENQTAWQQLNQVKYDTQK